MLWRQIRIRRTWLLIHGTLENTCGVFAERQHEEVASRGKIFCQRAK
jgi:hypothetical protein